MTPFWWNLPLRSCVFLLNFQNFRCYRFYFKTQCYTGVYGNLKYTTSGLGVRKSYVVTNLYLGNFSTIQFYSKYPDHRNILLPYTCVSEVSVWRVSFLIHVWVILPPVDFPILLSVSFCLGYHGTRTWSSEVLPLFNLPIINSVDQNSVTP